MEKEKGKQISYNSPQYGGKPCFVPIVAKSRDWLIGYLYAARLCKRVVNDISSKFNICILFNGLDGAVSSTRFNNIINDGTDLSKITNQEIKKINHKRMNDFIESKINPEHPENKGDILSESFVSVQCPNCQPGFYSFDDEKQIPSVNFYCGFCGHPIIQYTGNEEIDYFK